ncbi:MAG: XRE family transcriptional regulator [Myxococcota bacterium]
MSRSAQSKQAAGAEPVRVLGRGLGAKRGVHLTLRTIRDAVGKTQVDVARESGIDQADVSRLESRQSLDDCHVATLRRYVEALGGELELVARFGDSRIAVVGVPEVD